MSFIEALTQHIPWSKSTFGIGKRTKGITNHIRKELNEIELNPDDLNEWIDVIILATDGAWRIGYTPAEIELAFELKLAEIKKRTYPFPISEDEPSEHLRQ